MLRNKVWVIVLTAVLLIVLSAGMVLANDEGLISYWSFDEGQGTEAIDEIGGHDGTLYGPTWDSDNIAPTPGNLSSLKFDGNDYIVVPSDEELNVDQITISAWIYIDPANSQAQANIVRKGPLGSGTNRVYGLTVRGDRTIRAFVVLNDGRLVDCDGGEKLNADTWYHVALTYDGNKITVYVNGEWYHESSTMSGDIGDNDNSVLIGGIPGAGWYFKGNIDEVSIYNEALTASEIEQLADITPPDITVPDDMTVFAACPDGTAVDFTVTAIDEVDGEVSVDCEPAPGSVFPVGETIVECTAVDLRGNTARTEFTINVIYDFDGFFKPIDMDAVNNVKAGSAVPIKFSLNGDMGLDIFENGYPRSNEAENLDNPDSNLIETVVTAGNSSLSYDPAADQYTYVWKTAKEWAGTTRQLVVKFKDGTEVPTVNFKFK